jgi:hypothetical protein
MAKFRWLIFALGVLGLLETPILIARLVAETDRTVLITSLTIALPIRIGVICVCFWMWYKFQPSKSAADRDGRQA